MINSKLNSKNKMKSELAKVLSDFVNPKDTTNGMLAKSWRRFKGKILLYKSGTEGFANSGLESYSEYYAGQVAKAMELHHV